MVEIDSLVVRLMGHAAMAKAYGDAIRRDPALAGGFEKLAARHVAAVKTLSDEIGIAAVAVGQPSAAVLPFAANGG